MAFEPGDVVMLKSGGPSMTVVSAAEDEITCLWFGDEGELFREAIPAIALESVFSAIGDDEEEEDEENEDEDAEDKDDDEEDDEEEEDEEDDEDEPAKSSKKRAK
ncbi:DUF2158 domain-containing protein [Xanthobacteraceae bacterium Astr-EGSB]|uniref:YodC family protein n=1 Tax=Astrobacterium formosum TaxID=3069710 RepID=UPI0027B1A45E|nr:DUF2158 domain-containing protein [Xanthobacteraceae bacterium Astr-EGSB]